MRRSNILHLCAWSVTSAFLTTTATLSAAEVDFAHDIVPILKQHCGKCHTGDQQKGGLSFNTRADLLRGGESGAIVEPGQAAESELLERLTTDDSTLRMPPQGVRLSAKELELITRWVDGGLKWEDGFTFGQQAYEPPLKPRRPELPAVVDGREHPLDRIIDATLRQSGRSRPAVVNDETFLRRASLDLVGLLPTTEQRQRFLADDHPEKRARLIAELLQRDVDYAEHWLTFWNDLLRNDYTGTGFITGGRTQISKWLYAALVANRPYDQMVRELIAPPTPESAGFANGIRWRGDVSAGQTVEIQFAQSVGQAFLGINLKCASCHDSFIDRWKLTDSFGLAAIYSTRPLDIHRCDQPTGQQAKAYWLFPELGTVDPQADQPERLKQLAALMTHPENGRFTRTIVNRLWHRLMGRGIVEPTDAMQSEPWSADLLDYLASDFADHQYDLKRTISLIATSQAYQERVEPYQSAPDERQYVYAGPRARRLTAEQFMDAVWQLTDTAPKVIDAPVVRGKPLPGAKPVSVDAKWIWARADALSAPGGETVTFRAIWNLPQKPQSAIIAATCDNSYTLAINGQPAGAGEAWNAPDAHLVTDLLQSGDNEIIVVAKNGGEGPNPAGLLIAARAQAVDGQEHLFQSGTNWQWTASVADRHGQFANPPSDWKPAAEVTGSELWSGQVQPAVTQILNRDLGAAGLMVRASLVKSDFLMRSLGRPNRDQIVSVRPSQLTTLEAIDLSNGETLAELLERGSRNLLSRKWESPAKLVDWVFRSALTRQPTPAELQTLEQVLGQELTEQGIQDVLWSVIMLPEFQLVR